MNPFAEQSQSPLLLKMIRYGIFVLLCTPLVVHQSFLYSYSSLKVGFILAAVEIIFLCFIWLIAFYPGYRPKLSFLGKSFFVFVGILLLASIVGVDPSTSFFGVASRSLSGMVWIHFAMIFYVLCGVFRTKKDWQTFFLVSVGVGVMVSLLHLFSLVGVSLLANAKNGSTLGNSSFLGTYLLFELFFAAYLFFTTKHKIQIFSAVAFGVFVLALLTSTAEAAVLSFFGGVVLFGIVLLILNGKTKTQRAFGIGLLVFLISAFIVLFVLALFPDTSVRQYVASQTSSARFALWKIALQAFQERPFLGWGIENFKHIFLKFYDPCFGSKVCGLEIWFDRAHNQWLDLLVQAGLAGLVAFLTLLSAVAVRLWKSLRAQQISPVVFSVILAFFAAYFAQNLTVFDTGTSVLLFVGVLAFIDALSVSDLNLSLPKPQMHGNGEFYFVQTVTTLIVPFSLFFFVIQPMQANYATVDVVRSTNMSDRLSAYEIAITLTPIGVDTRRSFLAGQTWTMIWDLDSEQRVEGRRFFEKELMLAEDGLVKTIRSTPSHLIANLDLGFIYFTHARYYDESKYVDAVQILQEAISLHPNNPLPYEELAMVYLDKGEIDLALPLMENALALDPKVKNTQLRRLIAYLFTKDEKLIEQKAQETLEVFPTWRDKIDLLLQFDSEKDKDVLLSKFYYDIQP